MFLCLMRHGQAEPFVTGMDDSIRQLTDKGKQQVMAMAALAKRWWPSGETHIWASPYVRAQSTALIMGRTLHAASITSHDAIAEGNLPTFYHDVLAQESADMILVVGHVPALTEWLEAMTGNVLSFKAGGLVFLEYDPTAGMVGHGTLLYYVQPKAIQWVR